VFIANATVICSLGHRLCICTVVARSIQLCMPRSLNQVPASADRGKDGNVTSAGWQVTL